MKPAEQPRKPRVPRRRIANTKKLGTFSTQEMQVVSPQYLAKMRANAPALAPARSRDGTPIWPEAQQAGYCEVAETRAAKSKRRAQEAALGIKLKPKAKIRKCHVELQLVGDAGASELGVQPGAYLMACSRPQKPGVMIPVRDPAHATRVSERFCSCRSANRAAGDCATEAQAQAQALTGPRRRRR